MSHAVDSKSAAVHLIDPLNAPEPSAMDGPGTHFGNTMAAHQPNAPSPVPSNPNNPYRTSSRKSSSPTTKGGVSTRVRASSNAIDSSRSYRTEAFGEIEPTRQRSGSHGTPPSYQEATSPKHSSRHRRSSSLKERYPGDHSHEPLDVIRKDSKRAHRSPHLNKRQMPGTDTIDRLDPGIGGRSYHHEGPFDAALMGRNSRKKYSPIAALETSNAEALKATPPENIKDALERHRPLDGVAIVPPGMQDRFGRTYKYEEGSDLMHEPSDGDAGYKRWPDLEYDPEDLKGHAEPMFSLDRALKAHRIDENGIEMEDRAGISKRYHDQQRSGTLDRRDPVDIAGDESKYGEMARANVTDNDLGVGPSSSVKASLKKRIGSLRHRKNGD